MTRLALPEGGKTVYSLPDQGTDTGQMVEMYEQNKRLNGRSPLPALLMATDPDREPANRNPVFLFPVVSATDEGTEDFVPVVVAAQAKGDFTDAESTNPGWFFGINLYTHTGDDPEDGEGLVQFIGTLAEASHRSAASMGTIVGLWAEAALMTSGADDAHVSGMISMKVAAPKRKDGCTTGVADNVYGLYIDEVDPETIGASNGYSLFVAGGRSWFSGPVTVAGNLGIHESATVFFGDCHLTTDGGGSLIANHAMVADFFYTLGSSQAASFLQVGSSGNVGIFFGTGSPEGVKAADRGSLYLNLSGGAGTTLYVKETGLGTNTGWVGK